MPDGTEIIGVWLHDRLNGRALRTLPGKEQSEVIYKDDLAIDLTIGLNFNQKSYICASPILDIIIVAGIAGGLGTSNAAVAGFILALIAAIAYWVWSCQMPSSTYI